jgi:hypothetical protein
MPVGPPNEPLLRGAFMRHHKMTLALALVLYGSSACGDLTDPGVLLGTATVSAPANIVLGASAVTLTIGQPVKVQATVVDASGVTITDATIFYRSADSTVVAVSSNGTVNPLRAGDAVISLVSGKAQAQQIVHVNGADLPPVVTPVVPPAGSSSPTLPQGVVDINMPVAPAAGGSIISVPVGGDLQAAINQAKPGDVIELAAGSVFTGNFILPAKATSPSWIIIRPASSVSLPAAGTRMTPAVAAALRLPKILTNSGDNAIKTAMSANHYRLIGLEVSADPTLSQGYGLIGLGGDASQGQTTVASVPHDLVLDRLYVHGTATLPLRRCIALNAASAAVIDSYVSDCHDAGSDAQAIGSWNGPGPFLIQNNYLEGSTENILFGGGDAAIAELSPADVTIRRNYISKPVSWKGSRWAIKTIIEFKNAKRVLIEGNVIEHNWLAVWDGTAVTLKSVNQDGTAPWSGTTDVTMRNNIIRDAGSGMNLHGNPENTKPTIHMSRVAITNNLVLGIKSDSFPGQGNGFFLGGDLSDITIDHNTLVWTGWGVAVNMEGAPPPPFHRLHITNTVFATVGGVGVQGQSLGYPGPSWAGFAPDGVLTGNAFALGAAYMSGLPGLTYNSYPAGNTLLANETTTFGGIGFANRSSGDVRLSASSPFAGKANDGTDPGANVSAVLAATAGVVAGTP